MWILVAVKAVKEKGEPSGAVEWRSRYGNALGTKMLFRRSKGEGGTRTGRVRKYGCLIVDRTKHARITRKDATIKSRQAGSEVEG